MNKLKKQNKNEQLIYMLIMFWLGVLYAETLSLNWSIGFTVFGILFVIYVIYKEKQK